jgi:hypothetical protein
MQSSLDSILAVQTLQKYAQCWDVAQTRRMGMQSGRVQLPNAPRFSPTFRAYPSPACSLDRDHANVVIELLTRREAADLIYNGREKLFDGKSG